MEQERDSEDFQPYSVSKYSLETFVEMLTGGDVNALSALEAQPNLDPPGGPRAASEILLVAVHLPCMHPTIWYHETLAGGL